MKSTIRSWTGERAATRRPAERDVGLTFVELLVTIVLMGTVVVAVLAASQSLIISSRTNREAAAVESALIAAAQGIEGASRSCNQDMDSVILAAVGIELGLTPAQADPYVDTSYRHLLADNWQPNACPGTPQTFQANLVQRVHIKVTSPDNGLWRELEVIKSDI